MRVVICGGGVIGACAAYFLSRRGIDVTVVERTEVAAAASGKAGGFLALDWCVGTPLDALARRSFLLHAELPNVVAGDWGYRGMTAYSGFVVPEGDARRHAAAKLTWLSDGVIIASRLGTTDTTAIVHPRAFTAAMMSAAQGHGAELRHGRVTGIVRRADGSTVRGVEVDGGVIESDAVVVAMGPWSQMAAEWMVCPPCSDGNTLVTAFSDEAPLPLDPATVTPDRNEVDRLKVICERVSPAFQAENIIAGQACFRPVTLDGMPLIGKVPQIEGAYVATGHSVWGILNAPATGEALAELIADGAARSTDLRPFYPSRLRPLHPSLVRWG